MAATLNISAQDITAAANYLEQYLTDTVAAGDFRKGTALRDLTAQALAAIFAFVRADALQIRQMSSLKTVREAAGGDEEALRDSVAAILSNLFIELKAGNKSRGRVVCHTTQQADIFVPVTARFYKSADLVFSIDSDATYFIPRSQLSPVIDANNNVTEWLFDLPLVAVNPGTAGNIPPGLFSSFDRFSLAVSYVENTDSFSGGRGEETVDEVLARAPTALSVRNLINDRSITAVLNENFGDVLQNVFVAGMGMPEMQRDIVPGIASHLKFHVGGCADIYLTLPPADASFDGAVNGLFNRGDGFITVFRDGSVSFASVLPGDIISIKEGLPVVPSEFLVVEVLADALIVSELAPFPVATEEQDLETTVSYTIGRIGPSYVDVLSDVGGTPLTTGYTSRQLRQSGAIVMPSVPVVEIADVMIINPRSSEAAFKSPVDGFVHFPNQVNDLPTQGTAYEGLRYKVTVHNPFYTHSTQQWMEIRVGADDNLTRFNGFMLRVKYRTLSGFASIDSFVRSRRERTCAASQLARGHNPVVVWTEIFYKLKATATAALNNNTVARIAADYINQHDSTISPLDVSALETVIRNSFPSIASVRNLIIYYALLSPTGDRREYLTTDEVKVSADKQLSGPEDSLDGYGVTDRTLRYFASSTRIRAQQVY